MFVGKKYRKGTKTPTKRYAAYKAKQKAKTTRNRNDTVEAALWVDTGVCAATGNATEDHVLQLVNPSDKGTVGSGHEVDIMEAFEKGPDYMVAKAGPNAQAHVTQSLAYAKEAVKKRDPVLATRVIRANKGPAFSLLRMVSPKAADKVAKLVKKIPIVKKAVEKVGGATKDMAPSQQIK